MGLDLELNINSQENSHFFSKNLSQAVCLYNSQDNLFLARLLIEGVETCFTKVILVLNNKNGPQDLKLKIAIF